MRISSLLTVALVIAACTAHAQPGAAPTASDTLVCTAGAASVELDRKAWTATYLQNGALVGSSKCGGTRMAAYNMACIDDARFHFLFAGVPGPAILGGKSARLDANGKTVLLDCR